MNCDQKPFVPRHNLNHSAVTLRNIFSFQIGTILAQTNYIVLLITANRGADGKKKASMCHSGKQSCIEHSVVKSV